ncbi:hypothetical protein [Paludisphaera sp.]|uniref:hypothetical protein n=1 Tax=Paludisphaera sp. TaxID=2017432 RepID=UPI00301D717B
MLARRCVLLSKRGAMDGGAAMARVTCRCGEAIEVDREGGPERVVCPRCNARIRVRRAEVGGGDGLIRFHCPCGRRLKVRAAERPEAGRCPDCGRVVPVPQGALASAASSTGPGAGGSNIAFDGDGQRTAELDADDIARLKRWAARHGVVSEEDASSAVPPPIPSESSYSPPPALRVEAGLRVCPRCGRPLHMSAVTCRACGAPTPKG